MKKPVSKGRLLGSPPKPNEVGLVGKGGATERLSFSAPAGNEGCAVCDDAACLSPLSFFTRRKMEPPEAPEVGKQSRPVKT